MIWNNFCIVLCEKFVNKLLDVVYVYYFFVCCMFNYKINIKF